MSNSFAFEQLISLAGITQVNSTQLYPALHQPGDVGLPMLVVDNVLGRAVIALQGAHVMSFQPAGWREMLWISPKCILAPGKAIRGGIPLCLPWFGPSADGKVAHGFARTLTWSPIAAEIMEDGTTRLVLELAGDASTSTQWPHAFVFQLEVLVGRELKLSLSAQNCSTETAPLAFAFHTYFAVANVAEAHVSGLDGTTYIDKMDNVARKQQLGEVTISAITDRIYLDVPARQTLLCGDVQVHIDSDSKCAVVWNAWTNDKTIADMGEGNHVGYLCVERCDVADRAQTLAPGAQYQMTMTLAG